MQTSDAMLMLYFLARSFYCNQFREMWVKYPIAQMKIGYASV